MSETLEQMRERAAAHERELAEGEFMSVAEVASLIKLSQTYVRDIPADELPYGEFGHGHKLKRRRYRRAEVYAYIDAAFSVSR